MIIFKGFQGLENFYIKFKDFPDFSRTCMNPEYKSNFNHFGVIGPKSMNFSKIMQNNGHYTVQGHPKSLIQHILPRPWPTSCSGCFRTVHLNRMNAKMQNIGHECHTQQNFTTSERNGGKWPKKQKNSAKSGHIGNSDILPTQDSLSCIPVVESMDSISTNFTHVALKPNACSVITQSSGHYIQRYFGASGEPTYDLKRYRMAVHSGELRQGAHFPYVGLEPVDG